MGRQSRLNPRSPEGGKPAAYVSLHRLWRAVDFFQGDVVQFEAWLATKDKRSHSGMRFLWNKRYPPPLVTIAHG